MGSVLQVRTPAQWEGAVGQHHCGVDREHRLREQILSSVDNTCRERTELNTEEQDEGSGFCSEKLNAGDSILCTPRNCKGVIAGGETS